MLMTAVKLHIVCTLTKCFLGDQCIKAGVGGTYSTDDEISIAYFTFM